MLFICSVLSHYPTGLNGHPVVEELCDYLGKNHNESPFYLAFLVDKLEEKMQSDSSLSTLVLPQTEQVIMQNVRQCILNLITQFAFRYCSPLQQKLIPFVGSIGYFCLDF